MMKKEVKKNIATSSSGGDQTVNGLSVSEIPSTSKIKQDNVQKLDLAKSDLLKQGMVKDLSQNPSPIYKEHYINKLASLGYDKKQLDDFAKSIEQGNPQEYKSPMANTWGVLQPIADWSNDFASKAGSAIIEGGEKMQKGVDEMLTSLGDQTGTVSDKAKEELHGALTTGTGTTQVLFNTLPVALEFNAAVDATKTAADKNLSKEHAQTVNKVLDTPFTLASKLTDALNIPREEGTNNAMIIDLLNFAAAAGAFHGLGEVKEQYKSIQGLKDLSKKVAENNATPQEKEDLSKIADGLSKVNVQDIKQAAEKSDSPQAKEIADKINTLQDKVKPEHDELHDKLAELQQKTADPEFQKLPIEVQSGIMRDVEDTQNEISARTQDQLTSQLQDAHNNGEVKDLDNKIEQTEASMEGQPPAVKDSMQETLNSLKSKRQDAVQKSSASSVLQHSQESTGETGSERTGVESSQQGNEPTEENKTEVGVQETPKETVGVEGGDKLVLDKRHKEIRADKDHYPFDFIDKKGNNLGVISVNERRDLGGYQVETSEIKNRGKGNGKKMYKALIESLDKPLISDISLTKDAKGLWESLVKDGVAEFDETIGKYKSKKLIPEIKSEEQQKTAVPEGPELTKITHAAIEADRAKLGLPPIEKEPSDIKGDFVEAQKTFRDNPRLAQEAIESGKPVDRKDVYRLALDKMDLKAKAKKYREQILKFPEQADELKAKLLVTETAIDINDQALKNVSSEAGKALQAMQTALAEDTSLENTLLTARSYSKNGKITAEQERKFTEITSRLENLEKEFTDYKEEQNKKDAQKTVDNIITEPKEKKTVFNRTKKERLAKIDELKNKWKALGDNSQGPAKQGIGITDEHIKIIAQLAAEYIGLGVTEFKALAKKIKNDIGEISDDDLKSIFENESIDGKKLSDFADETELKKDIKISKTEKGKIKNLRAKIRNLVAKGHTDIDSIVSEIHKDIPEMTERQIRDEISGYGKTQELSSEEIDKKIREVKRVGGLLSALEDAEGGSSPKRTGLKRDELTEEEKKLRSLIGDAMRKNQADIETGDMTPEQWKTALDKYKKRLENQLKGLEEKKKNNDYEIKKKHVLELDAKALELKRKIDKEKGNRKRELEKIRLANRGEVEKSADNILKLMRFGILASAHKAILKLGIAGAAKGYIQNPINILIAGVYSKIPYIRDVYNQSPRHRSKGSTKAYIHGMAEAWSKKTWNDVRAQLRGGKHADEIQFGTDKGHLPPGLAELWNVEHKILKTPLMNAEFRTSMEKNLQFLADKGMNIMDPTVINIASARANEDALRAVYMAKNSLVTGYHAALRSLAAETKDGSVGGKVIGKVLEGENLIVKVPTNFIQEQLESTPIGALQFLYGIRKGVNDLPPDVADRLARKMNNATAGTILLAIAGLNYLNHFGGNKYIRQGNNKAAKEEDSMKEEEMNIMGINVPPYMQHFNFAQQLQMGAGIARIMDYYNEIDKKHHEESENHFTKAAWEAMGSTASKIPFAESAVKMTEAMKGADAMEKLMGSFIDNVFALPGYAAKAIDPEEKRVANNPWEHIKSNIPGVRETLPSKADIESNAKLAKLFKKFRNAR